MKFAEMGPMRQRAVLLGVLMVVVIVLVLLAEAAVRVRSFLASGTTERLDDTYVIHQPSGLRIPRPGLTTDQISVNSMGFRGDEIEMPKPRGRVRIAFLGASTTYCAEVSSNAHAWPHLVTDRMREAFPNRDFDHVNAGVPGYGVSHSGTNYRERIAVLDPDVVVIYHATNDLSANSFEIAHADGLVKERTGNERFWLSDYSLLVHLVELNLKIMWLQAQAQSDGAEKLDVDPAVLAKPFREDLAGLVREVAADGRLVVLATFSPHLRRDQTPDQQLAAANTSLYYMPYMTIEGLLDAFDGYNAVIADVAARSGSILVRTESAIPGDVDHYNDSVHFLDAGSRAMADVVFRTLSDSPTFRILVE